MVVERRESRRVVDDGVPVSITIQYSKLEMSEVPHEREWTLRYRQKIGEFVTANSQDLEQP